MMSPALRRLLWPETIAIVGASPTQVWTKHMLHSLERLGYPGEAFLINPRHREVDGVRCYPGIRELPRRPDAVIVVVRRELAIDVVAECAECGVGGVVVLTGGFAEVGAEGRALEERLIAPARRTGMAVLGPNCQGFINCLQPSALWMDEIFEPLRSGGVAVISHSGSVSTGIMNHLYRRGVYTNYTISLGNESVVTVADLIDAFVDDDQVRIIAAYLETIRNPSRFFAACDRAAAANKPVVVMKVGRSPAAAAAVQAHTGALAGSDRMVDARFRQHRVVRVQSLSEMVETCIAFSGRRLRTPRLTAFASSGGQIEAVVDAAAQTGLQFPPFQNATAAKLCEGMTMYRECVAGNPFDSGGIKMADTIDTLGADPDIDSIMFITQTRRHPTGIMHPMEQLLGMAERLHDTTSKPIVVLSANDDVEPAVSLRLAPRGIALVGGIESGLRALDNVWRYADAPDCSPSPIALDPATVRRIGELREPLSGQEALDLFAALGLNTVRSLALGTPDEAVAAARQLGFPVVVKTGARDVLHKTDSGQVFLKLTTEEAVRGAAERVKPPILVQTCVTAGVEIIVGLHSDPELGVFIAVGLGGVLAELLDKVVLRAVPLGAGAAAEMVAELPLQRLLDGYRGSAPADRAALIWTIERVAALGVAAGSAIKSIDLNPVIATRDGAFIVDAVVVPLVGASADSGEEHR
jgi:acetate---CoA ligase (ADP-forming)